MDLKFNSELLIDKLEVFFEKRLFKIYLLKLLLIFFFGFISFFLGLAMYILNWEFWINIVVFTFSLNIFSILILFEKKILENKKKYTKKIEKDRQHFYNIFEIKNDKFFSKKFIKFLLNDV